MKNIKIQNLLFLPLFLVLFACSSDDDTPEIVNEEEVITTVVATLVPDGGGTTVILTSRDTDGDGPNDPVVTVSGNLIANTTYGGSVQFLNETVTPAEDITDEVSGEAEEHQVFFIPSANLNAEISYLDFDSNNNPLGTVFGVQAGEASTGTLTIVLRHEPQKPNDGTLSDAGGETDVSVSFELTIE